VEIKEIKEGSPRQLLEQRRSSLSSGRGYAALLWGAALLFVVVLATIIEGIVSQSTQAFGHFGIGFLWSTAWNEATNSFGAGQFIVGTVTVTLIAMIIAVPVGLATAAFLTEMCPRRIATPLGIAIDLIAAVPSIVVGLWGLYVMQPIFLRDVEPFMKDIPVVSLLFKGNAEGPSYILAGFVLSIMIVPTMVALSRTALAGVGVLDREAAFALGATPWQVVRKVVVPGANSGILAASTLALGRAVGETIAITLLIGNTLILQHPFSLLNDGATLGSVIVLNFGESQPGTLLRSTLLALAVVLLVITLIVNIGGRFIVRKSTQFRLP
jgi:phosphate transport system permease protein